MKQCKRRLMFGLHRRHSTTKTPPPPVSPALRAEKSKVISVDIENVEQRVDAMIELLTHSKSRLIDCLRTRSSQDILDKRKKKLAEYAFAQTLLADSKNLETILSDGLLSEVVMVFGNALNEIVEETVRAETDIEHQVIDQLNTYAEFQKQKNRDKEKLKKLVLDRDSAQARLTGAQVRGERTESIEEELDTAKSKMESSKDVLSTEIFDLAAAEVDMANVFRILIKTYMEYYKSVYSILEECLPRVTEKIDKYPRRPVYGCHLDDHLRYSGRNIAKVLEVCCAVLYESGIQLEGLFRVPGNVLKVKKLKSAFDAGEIDLSDAEIDTYAFAGALTSYLCSLPDSLMCNRFYDQWIEAAQTSSPEEKRQTIKRILEMLPHSNFENLRYFIKFLAKVAENEEYTKMGAKNLAIVASNSLLRSDSCDSVIASGLHGALVECLISEADYFFPDEISFSSSSVCSPVAEDDNVSSVGYNSLDSGYSGSETRSAEAYYKKTKPPAPPPPKFVENMHNTSMSVISEHCEPSLSRRSDWTNGVPPKFVSTTSSSGGGGDHPLLPSEANAHRLVKPAPPSTVDSSPNSPNDSVGPDDGAANGNATETEMLNKPVPRHRKSKSATISMQSPVKSASCQKLNETFSEHDGNGDSSSSNEKGVTTMPMSSHDKETSRQFTVVPMRPPLPSKAAFERRSSLKHVASSESKASVMLGKPPPVPLSPDQEDHVHYHPRRSRFDSFSSGSSNDDSLMEMTGSSHEVCNRLSKSAMELHPHGRSVDRKPETAAGATGQQQKAAGGTFQVKPMRRNLPPTTTANHSLRITVKPPLPSKPRLHDDDNDITKL